MKKSGIVFATLVLAFVLSGCSTQKESNNVKEIPKSDVTLQEQSNITKRDVREVVWDQLTSKDKERVEGNWQASKSNKMILTESMGIINDKSYIGKEVYLVDFQTKSISIPNNMIVYASLYDYKIVGYGIVE
jgi:hypothetical protein